LLERVRRLELQLEDLQKVRQTQRKWRRRSRQATAALVGYTNAGKSTLLNKLTDAGVLTENRLFSTLDPTVRRLALPGGEVVLLSDTVGFVRDLPHALVEAFKSTLDETAEADLMIHIVDASAADPEGNMRAVEIVLEEIGASGVPQLLVFNKTDVAWPAQVEGLLREYPDAISISAATGVGIEALLGVLAEKVRALSEVVELFIPYDRGDVLAALHREGEVLVSVHEENGTQVQARLGDAAAGKYNEFVVPPAKQAKATVSAPKPTSPKSPKPAAAPPSRPGVKKR
jgi:GTPase